MRVSWMLFSLFGLVVVERTIISLVSMKLILPDQAQVLRVFFLFLQIVINILLRDHILLLVAVQFVWFCLPDLFAVIVQKQRESLFQEQLISMLDSWIITMRSGKSLRQAQLFYLEKTKKPVQYILNEYMIAIQYQQNVVNLSQNRQMQIFFRELEQIEKQSHKSVERLKALRRKLMMEKFFRQKSRQATLQVKSQSLIISFMYVGLMIYVHLSFGLARYQMLVMFSLVLFIVGLVCVQRMGRFYKWKI